MANQINVALVRQIVEQIEAKPEKWDQGSWATGGVDECSTRFCFAGWALALSGYLDPKGRPNYPAIKHAVDYGHDFDLSDFVNDYTEFPWGEVAQDLLGFTEHQADILFAGYVDDEQGGSDWDAYKRVLKRETGLVFPTYEIDVAKHGKKVVAWTAKCSECGEIFRSPGISDADHDDTVLAYVDHDKNIHGGSGEVPAGMLVTSARVA